jgi:acetoin utilization deacetylase AcuC-like enzyme
MSTAIYSHPDCLRHEMGEWHPESPARLQAIEDQLISARLDGLIERREPPLAELPAVMRNHSAAAIALVRENLPGPGEYYPLDADTLLNQYSYQAALRAAGAAMAATDAVIAGDIDNAFCATRPPGHHARPGGPMGFCLFNNVALAALHALDSHGLERVAIIDFDVHHGNGTEEIFAGDERVLMAGIFQHPFYPYCGTENPAANMCNVPLPAGTRGDDFRQVVSDIWLPRLREFQPEMVFISAGFDAHYEDDMASLGLVESDYAWVTEQIKQVADEFAKGRIVSLLEGGYVLSALARSVATHIKVLADL